MLQAAPEGKKLCENLHFLGGFGVQEIEGLTVACAPQSLCRIIP